MRKILLFGYYGYHNFGDDLFESIFYKYLLKNTCHEVIVARKLEFESLGPVGPVGPVDFIFLGGGEIIAEFFLFKLFSYIDKYSMYHVPIFGASIGFNPDAPIELLDFFDKCIFRNKIYNKIDDKNFFYDNDIIFYSKFTKLLRLEGNEKEIQKNTIGVYLINIITIPQLTEIINFLLYCIEQGFTLKFILFDLKKDEEIINKIISALTEIKKTFMYLIVKTDDIKKKIMEINSCEKHFCMRYHSHVLCYILKKNIISFPVPMKTQLLVKNYNIPFGNSCREWMELFHENKDYYKKFYFDNCKYGKIKNFFDKKKGSDKRNSMWYKIFKMYESINEKNKKISVDDFANKIDQMVNFHTPSINYRHIYERVDNILKQKIIKPSCLVRLVTDSFPEKYQLNPTIFKSDGLFFYLTRQETNILHWSKSVFSYKMYVREISDDISEFSPYDVKLIIKDKLYDEIHRNNSSDPDEYMYLLEDVKLYDKKVNGVIYGFCNVLTQFKPDIHFKVGLVSFDPLQKEIKLEKILQVDFESGSEKQEKNWYLLEWNNKFYVIYKIFPFVVYEFNFTTFELTHFVTINNLHLLEDEYKFLKKRLCSCYKKLFCSLVWGHFYKDDNMIQTLIRKKEKKMNYKYYPISIYWNEKDPEKISFHIQDKIYDQGHKRYINDIKDSHICTGISDKRYSITNFFKNDDEKNE